MPPGYSPLVHFDLVDRVLDLSPERIVTLKLVTGAEEYLQDHFPTFPVLPGVLMLEAMVQAGRRLAMSREDIGDRPLVLGKVRALKYGRFVRPGTGLRVEVTLAGTPKEGEWDLRGEGTVVEVGGGESGAGVDPGRSAVSGRFTLRPLRVAR